MKNLENKNAEQAFHHLKHRHSPLRLFESPKELIRYLLDPSQKIETKNQLYRCLVRDVQSTQERESISTALLWVSLWPALDAIHQRWNAFYIATPESLISEIGFGLSKTIACMDLQRVQKVAPALVKSTEREIYEEYQRHRKQNKREVPSSHLQTPSKNDAPLSENKEGFHAHTPELPLEDAELLKTLKSIIGQDTELVIRVVFGEENQREAGEHIDLRHDSARSRFRRAMRQLQHHFEKK